MPEKYLIDTCIWIDIMEDRKGYSNEPLGDWGIAFLAKLLGEKKTLIINDVLVNELQNHYSEEEITSMLCPYESIIVKLFSTEKERKEAKESSITRKVPYADALYAIMARNYALILVTRDNDFRKLKDISLHYKPEDLI